MPARMPRDDDDDPLAGLGLAGRRRHGLALAAGLFAGGLGMALGMPAGHAGFTAAAVAVGPFLTLRWLAATLHRTTVVPLCRCRDLLQRLATGQPVGPLPSPEAPRLAELVAACNTLVAAAAATRDAAAADLAATWSGAGLAGLCRTVLAEHAPAFAARHQDLQVTLDPAADVPTRPAAATALLHDFVAVLLAGTTPRTPLQVTLTGHGDRIELTAAEDRPGLRGMPRPSPVASRLTRACHDSARALGGSLHVEDSPSGGLQFRLELPALVGIALEP